MLYCVRLRLNSVSSLVFAVLSALALCRLAGFTNALAPQPVALGRAGVTTKPYTASPLLFFAFKNGLAGVVGLAPLAPLAALDRARAARR